MNKPGVLPGNLRFKKYFLRGLEMPPAELISYSIPIGRRMWGRKPWRALLAQHTSLFAIHTSQSFQFAEHTGTRFQPREFCKAVKSHKGTNIVPKLPLGKLCRNAPFPVGCLPDLRPWDTHILISLHVFAFTNLQQRKAGGSISPGFQYRVLI